MAGITKQLQIENVFERELLGGLCLFSHVSQTYTEKRGMDLSQLPSWRLTLFVLMQDVAAEIFYNPSLYLPSSAFNI